VIKESAELALSWVKMHAYDLGITNKRAQDPLRMPDATIDVHLHLPAGAQKKDGPSAGVAMVCSPHLRCSVDLVLKCHFLCRSVRSYLF
jgi:ATP-dependent Lon protease